MAVSNRPLFCICLHMGRAALVPTFAANLMFSWSGDLIAITALLGSARFALALASMDIGTSFGGIGASREMMFASLAEPAMMMIVFSVALIAGSTQLSTIAETMLTGGVGLRVSLALALVALVIVAVAENGRVPVDNPATHLELTMVHEAMVLEYSGRHLGLIDLASMIKLFPVFLDDRLCVRADGDGNRCDSADARHNRALHLAWQNGRRRDRARIFGNGRSKNAHIPGAGLSGRRPYAGVAWCAASVRFARNVMAHTFSFDVAHTLAGLLYLSAS